MHIAPPAAQARPGAGATITPSDRRGQTLALQARLLRSVLALLLSLALLLLPAPGLQGSALAWTLPGRHPASQEVSAVRGRGTAPTASAAIQEVAPPAAVQQISEALAPRRPRVSILEPADGAVLPDGPWTLRLQVEDWPLVDGGPLGLGPHLLIQLDDNPPMQLLETSLSLPALSPGSHRLTVMAARPWGEVVKRPGAFQQIRLHRVSPNPVSQPAPGTPQLLAIAPLEASPSEPLLLDWLLLDAPLQHLRGDDARWRLRVSVNGDSFLVEQETPLWLKGWKRGSNALLLELVDGRGEPLNPPFNSVVREVRLAADATRPAWLGGRLADADLQRLLGQAPPPAALAEAAELSETAGSKPSTAPEQQSALDGTPATPAGSGAADQPAPRSTSGPSTTPQSSEAPPAQQPAPVTPPAAQPPSPPPAPGRAGAAEDAQTSPEARHSTPASVEASEALETPPLAQPAAGASNIAGFQAPPTSPMPEGAPAEQSARDADTPQGPPPTTGGVSRPPATKAADTVVTDGSPPDTPAATPPPPRPAARDEVNADGTLIRPQPSGPLQALRERLQR